MANGDLPLYKALAIGRPWVLGVQNQVVSYCGTGVCDALLQNSVNALETFRYDTVLWQWSLAETQKAGQAPNAGPLLVANADGDDLLLPAGTMDAFVTGDGQPIGGGWFNKDCSFTDLRKEGAPIDRGFMFLITGFAFEVLPPFQRGGTGAAAADPLLFSSWLNPAPNGPNYAAQIRENMLNYICVHVTFGDTGCSYLAGTLSASPFWGGAASSVTTRNGLICTAGVYLPFTTAICVGSRDDVRKMTVTLQLDQALRVQANDAGPLPISGINGVTGLPDVATNHTINGTNDGTVYAPVRVWTPGYIVCVPDSAYCGIPMLTPDEIILFRQRMGLVPASPYGAPVAGPPAMPSPLAQVPAGYPR